MKTKQEVVQFFLQKNILVSENAAEELLDKDLDSFFTQIQSKVDIENLMILNKEIINLFLTNNKIDANWDELDKAKTLSDKNKNPDLYKKFIEVLSEEKKENGEEFVDDGINVKELYAYVETEKKREVDDFVAYFNNRYKQIEKMFHTRQELQGLTTISRVLQKKDKDSVSLIGIVNEKRQTKNGNIIIEIEDMTGSINVIVSKSKPELFNIAKDIVPDEVIAVTGSNSERIVFVNNLLHPDVPITNDLRKCPDEVYAIFLSDLHIGSTYFLDEEFDKFIKWINGEVGSEDQRNVAKKIKYIFIIGDLVDGVGIYPGQEEELSIKDIYKQYEECARQLRKIPKDKKLIICPGNHDASRISEPQPPLSKEFTQDIWDMPNTIMVANPSYINIHSSENFSGFDVLMYHGYSFDYYAANVDSIRGGGGYDRADLIMKFMIQRRHMAPTHTSTLYIPEIKEDPLVITKVPDFFVTGHIHKSSVSHYRNITLISGSCFQSKTPFQEKVGHKPEPARVPIVNLNTREVRILKF